jgi:hypothetical protein
MNRLRSVLGLLSVSAFTWAACGGGVPSLSGTRESGQSGLMDQTFAGKNKCNPENHDRPFIIEWDATDMSSFESYAANDVVVVRYEGCDLKVLDQCRNDSVRGSLGAYKPVEWTSGSLEKMDISNEGELVAKLPLGAATLGGRVQAGEKFHMEYYVAGTRTATRDGVYRADLEKLPGCKGATHFVYGYNLGAFALGSVQELNAAADVSIYGFGGGASKKSSQAADKKGGDLATCKSDSAKEIEGCKAPIRLTLRVIKSGESPEASAMKAPDTPESVTAAGMVNMKIEMSDEARARLESATQKMNAKDGKGCLAELDAHDVLDPKHKSTDPKSTFGYTRSKCLMLAGQCDAGKTLLRKTMEATVSGTLGPEQIDKQVEGMASLSCQGGNMSARDQVLKGLQDLTQGAFLGKKSTEFCMSAYNAVRTLAPKVKPKDEDDKQIIDYQRNLFATAPQCLAQAGDCEKAWKVFQEVYPAESKAGVKDPKQLETVMKSVFESTVKKCKK